MPQLLILRHAIALDRDEAASQNLNDAERPLTKKGIKRMEQVASGLQQLLDEPGHILSSPLLRARQTAEILASRYPALTPAISKDLAPGHSLPSLITQLNQLPREGPLVIVGHEPDLSTLAALLLCGEAQDFIKLKKTGAALLEFAHDFVQQGGTLQWLMEPTQLRAFART